MAERLAYSPAEAAESIDVSRPTIYHLMERAEDPLPNFRVGTRRLIPIESFKEWVRRQAEGGQING